MLLYALLSTWSGDFRFILVREVPCEIKNPSHQILILLGNENGTAGLSRLSGLVVIRPWGEGTRWVLDTDSLQLHSQAISATVWQLTALDGTERVHPARMRDTSGRHVSSSSGIRWSLMRTDRSQTLASERMTLV